MDLVGVLRNLWAYCGVLSKKYLFSKFLNISPSLRTISSTLPIHPNRSQKNFSHPYYGWYSNTLCIRQKKTTRQSPEKVFQKCSNIIKLVWKRFIATIWWKTRRISTRKSDNENAHDVVWGLFIDCSPYLVIKRLIFQNHN